MAETTDPQAAPAPDNTHWGVAYLREDLQDLRQQMREDNKDLRQQMAETNQRIDGINESLGQRIEETNQRIDGINESLGQRIDSRFAWSITTMVALAGILIAVIKL
jgi:DNA anti-recombination protein RmuC